MTTPNNNTPSAIINDAYLDAGIIQEGDSANSEQLAAGLRRLTDIINFEQTQGLKLWVNVDYSITLTADIGTYDLGPTADGGTVNMTKPLRVIEAYYLDSTGIRRPLIPLSWDDYTRLSQINQSGAINSYFVNKKQLVLSVFFWLIPDTTAATGTGHLVLQEQITGPINLTETVNFPIEWRMFLHWALADELSTGQPQAIMDRAQQRCERYRMALEDWDVEDASTSFAPDSRGMYWGQKFR